MAYKRAYVGLTLQCTRSSGIFTQDEAEMDDYADVAPEDRKQQRGGRTANASSGRYQEAGSRPAAVGLVAGNPADPYRRIAYSD
ncbi:hypothetical protein [Cohnella cellulosilytica]